MKAVLLAAVLLPCACAAPDRVGGQPADVPAAQPSGGDAAGGSPVESACAQAADAMRLHESQTPLARALATHGLADQAAATNDRVRDALGAAPRERSTAVIAEVAAQPMQLATTAGRLLAPLLPRTAADAASARSHQRTAAEFICACWGLDGAHLSPAQGSVPIPGAQGAVYAMDFLLNTPRLLLAPALQDRPGEAAFTAMVSMLAHEITPSEASRAHLRDASVQMGERLRGDAGLMWAIAQSLAHIDAELGITADWASQEADPVPPEIATAVEGTVLTVQDVQGVGWVAVGGMGANRYDMSRLAAVFDPGGDDHYAWAALREGNQAIIDLAGNDRYEGSAVQGPAGAWRGLALLIDRAGNDAYSGGRLGGGSGWLGVGVLIDSAGDDSYDFGSWALGAGLCGAGFLFDDAGRDLYFDRGFAQGLGGPAGVGLLVDAAGDDLHSSRGSTQGADRVPSITLSFSQGMAVGARGLVSGGVGVLVNGSGDDRFEADEFSQGGAYWHGLGLLLDGAGNDLYRGSHYTQGFGCHQAAGALIDLCGDDTYWSTVSAAQGAAWDEAIGVLVDGAGNDSYRGGALVQGSAAQSAIAALCDFGGSDHFSAAGPFRQGESGPNTYHPDHRPARSLSLLLLGRGDAFLSAGPWTADAMVQWPASGAASPLATPMIGVRMRGLAFGNAMQPR